MTIPYNYTWFNGITLNNRHLDTYNNLTRQVENAPSKQAAEGLRNQRHKFLMMCFSQYEKEDN